MKALVGISILTALLWAAVFIAIIQTYPLNPNIGGDFQQQYFDHKRSE